MGNFSYRKPPSADELSGLPVDVSVADGGLFRRYESNENRTLDREEVL